MSHAFTPWCTHCNGGIFAQKVESKCVCVCVCEREREREREREFELELQNFILQGL